MCECEVLPVEELYDVTIIGGGPAGLFSAFYSGLREMKTKVIEYQDKLGGKVHVYPEKMIWDVGGVPPISGGDFINNITAQGLTFEPTIVMQEKVTAIQKNDQNHFVIETASGTKHYSKTVIMAIGSGILKPEKINVKDAERFEIINLYYIVPSLKQFQDKVVLISGGGNAAIDWANALAPIAKKVYLVYRKGLLKGHEASVSQLNHPSVEIVLNSQITEFYACEQKDEIEQVRLRSESGEEVALQVDAVIVNHGYERDRSLLEESNLAIEMTDHLAIKTSTFCETSIAGLYAAGDTVDYSGKVHLIAGAFQDAANAVNQAKAYIAPDAEKSAMVSTHNELLKEKNKQFIEHLYK